jgi:hypothetical protein
VGVNVPAGPLASNMVPSALETPFSFDSDRCSTRGRYVKINVSNENLMSFLAVYRKFHVVSVTFSKVH